MEELKQGSVIARLTADELVRTDLKEFDFGETKASVAQINIMGRQQGLDKMPELLAALEAMRETEGFDLSFLM
jgi:manganese-dependent inorganic pyrophosphatase